MRYFLTFDTKMKAMLKYSVIAARMHILLDELMYELLTAGCTDGANNQLDRLTDRWTASQTDRHTIDLKDRVTH